jgi:hypothetical protein
MPPSFSLPGPLRAAAAQEQVSNYCPNRSPQMVRFGLMSAGRPASRRGTRGEEAAMGKLMGLTGNPERLLSVS